MVLRELLGNITSTSPVSSVPGGSVNKYWSPGAGLGECPLELF